MDNTVTCPCQEKCFENYKQFGVDIPSQWLQEQFAGQIKILADSKTPYLV